jgi:hypothetical protein
MVRKSYHVICILAAALMVYGCGSSSSGPSSAVEEEPVSGKVLRLAGGAGENGPGGGGGEIDVYSYRDVKFLSGGEVDASFTIPGDKPAYQACKVELKPGSNLKVKAYAQNAPLAAGTEYYLIFGNYSIFHAAAGVTTAAYDYEARVGCLDIPAGVTVTLGLNHDYTHWSHGTGQDTAYVYLDGSLRVAGTLTAATLNTAVAPQDGSKYDSGSLTLSAQDVFITPTGRVLARGRDNAAGDGGHGGKISINASSGSGGFLENSGTIDCSGGDATGSGTNAGDGGHGCNLAGLWWQTGNYLNSYGRMVNTGALLAHGGSGENGGNGGWLELNAESHLFNTGSLLGRGGDGAAGYGGNGDWAGLYSYVGAINNSGEIDISGGDGTAGGGDAGYEIEFYNNYAAPARNSGKLIARGGDATVNGNGGSGGNLDVYIEGGPILFAGSFDGGGGGAAGAGNQGGNGGYAYFYADYDYAYRYSEPMDSADIEVSADINLAGGSGDRGGFAGTLYVDQNYHGDIFPPSGEVLFKNYASIDLSGGDSAAANGGQGGDFYVSTEDAWYGDHSSSYVVGSIINQVAVTARGGKGSNKASFSGGRGGYVNFEAEGESYVRNSEETVVRNSGAIDVSGGSGYYGGDSGGVYFYGYNLVENTAEIVASGGKGKNEGGRGLYDDVRFFATENIVNTGMITGNGGAGTAAAGTGGSVYDLDMYAGGVIKNSGDLLLAGGDGGTYGGDGGWVDLLSQYAPTVNTAASISVQGGAGSSKANNGEHGTILIDWMDMTGPGGML